MANAFIIGKDEEVFTFEDSERIGCDDWYEIVSIDGKKRKKRIRKNKKDDDYYYYYSD